MSDKQPSAEEVARERSLARIFGSYALYLRSLPARVWEEGEHGWVSSER